MGRSAVSVRCQHLWESARSFGAESSVKFGLDTLHCPGPLALENAARGVLICDLQGDFVGVISMSRNHDGAAPIVWRHQTLCCTLACRSRSRVHDFEGTHVETRLLGALHDVVPVDLGLARELRRSGLPELTPLEASINAKKCYAKEAESLRGNGTLAFLRSRGFDRPATRA
jgi:hypothetical protein